VNEAQHINRLAGFAVALPALPHTNDPALICPSARSEQHGLDAERRAALAEPSVEGAEPRGLLGANGEMQGVPGAPAQRILVGEPDRRTALRPPHRQHVKVVFDRVE
jgi:hypothetical protein